jgi:carbon-monoxide dehydrogenase large subunit
MGQGLCTALAQICASELGLRAQDINVVPSDTAKVSLGLGGFASRQTVTAGSSVLLASQAVADKARKVASHMLEAAEHDLELADGEVRVVGAPQLSVKLGEIARILLGAPGYGFPAGVEPGLEANVQHRTDALTYANGCQVAEVEVDIETGGVHILRYIALQDSGILINPMMVEGQVHGGIAHGIGNALLERIVYDEGGQLTTGTLMDYALPRASDVPGLEVQHVVTPSPLNPLGVKGAGEGGTLPAPAAIANAVADALGVNVTEMPLTREYVWRCAQAAPR